MGLAGKPRYHPPLILFTYTSSAQVYVNQNTDTQSRQTTRPLKFPNQAP